jgi:hypothetical protein
MPRLSLYRPEKGNDFKMIDRLINEQFQVGGTDCMIHKYLGPVNPASTGTATPSMPINTNPVPELGIQDLLLMENRDRHYEPNVYRLRGVYTMIDTVFNLSQFGLFLNNEEILIHFHLRGTVESLGRKVMTGDVIELPHLKDEYALDEPNVMVALKRYYVITEVTRPSTGFSQTWYPHLLRAKCVPMVDSQEFAEILALDSGNGDGSTLKDILSTYNQSIAINNAVIAQAEADAPLSGYNTKSYYVIPTRDSGLVDVEDASDVINTVDSETAALDASIILNSPKRNFYVGYLTGDGVPPNGAPFTQGLEFPTPGAIGQFHLRTDYFPNRLFRWNGKHWTVYEENVRMTLTNNSTRQTQKTSFINNTTTATIHGAIVTERQALSKILIPKADN